MTPAPVKPSISTDLLNDLSHSREVTVRDWERRPMWEKLVGTVAWILERQQ